VDAQNLRTRAVVRSAQLVKPSLKQRVSAFSQSYRAAARNIFAEIKGIFAPMPSKSPGEKIPNFPRRAVTFGKTHPSLVAAAAVAVVPAVLVALANHRAPQPSRPPQP